MNENIEGTIRSWETRRAGRKPKKPVILHINVRDQHFLDAIKAEAAIRKMSMNSFLRSMIRGYFGAALHGR